jgi:hypothetical protein
MSAESYVLPQVKVFQRFRQISQDVVGNLNACIIGPHYKLARYDEASEKEMTKLNVLYVGDLLDSQYPLKVRNVDTNYVKVFFEKVTGKSASLNNAYILDGVVYNNYAKSIDFLDSVGKEIYGDSITLHDFRVDQLASGDKIYFVPCVGNYSRQLASLDSGAAMSDYGEVDYNGNFCAVLLKSARTGEVHVLMDEEINKLGLANAVNDYQHADVSRQPLVWGFDSYTDYGCATDYGYRLFYADGCWDGEAGGIALRPEVVVEYLDKLQAHPELAGKISFSVFNSTDVTDVVVEKSDYGIRVKIPFTAAQHQFDKIRGSVALNELFRVGLGVQDDENPPGEGVFVRPILSSRQSFEAGVITDRNELVVYGQKCTVDGSSTLDNGVYFSDNVSTKRFSNIPDNAEVLFVNDRHLVTHKRSGQKSTVSVYNVVDGVVGSKLVDLAIPGSAYPRAATIAYNSYVRLFVFGSDNKLYTSIRIGNFGDFDAGRACPSGFQWNDYATIDDPDGSYSFGYCGMGDRGRIVSFVVKGFGYVAIMPRIDVPELVVFSYGAVNTSAAVTTAGIKLNIDFDSSDNLPGYLLDNGFFKMSYLTSVDGDAYVLVHTSESTDSDGATICRLKFTAATSGNHDLTTIKLFEGEGQYLRLPEVFRMTSLFSGRLLVLNGDLYAVDYKDKFPVSITPITDRTNAFPFGFGRGAAVATVGTIGDLGVGIGSVISHGNGYSTPVSGFSYIGGEPYVQSAKCVTNPSIVKDINVFTNNDCVNTGGCGTQVRGEYAGDVDTTYVLTRINDNVGGISIEEGDQVIFHISDTSGIDIPYDITVDTDNCSAWLPLGVRSGLEFCVDEYNDNLWSAVLGKGTSFAIKCFAPNKTVNGVRLLSYTGLDYDLASITPKPVFSAAICKSYGSLEVPEFNEDGLPNWIATDEGIILSGGIQVRDSEKNLVTVVSAQPYIQYRALQTTYADTIHEVASTNDVQTSLGTISMDNPLAQGCYHAILNSGQQPVFFIAIKSDDQKGYAAALERLEVINNIYSLVPMTTDDAVLDDIQSHVKKMSGEETKLWRIAVVGVSTDKTIAVYNNAHHKLDNEFDATVEGTFVTFEDKDETIATDEVWPGDEFRYYYDDEGNYESRIVDHVIDNTHIVLTEPFEEDSIVMRKCEVWRELTSAQWIDYVGNKISAFRDRRMYAIFPEVLWNNGNKYPGYIGAAAIAGLISSVPPQQGLTNITLNGFDDIPMVYSSYTRTQLNYIADSGGLIIMQDVPGGQVYVRHQVSTAARDGNLLTTELSVTKDVDAISYYMAGILEPYIGKYNITPVLLEQIRTTVQGALNYLCSYNTGAGLLGPMLLATDDTKIVGIRQHEQLKDHVIVSVTLDIPLPCNVIELYLSV